VRVWLVADLLDVPLSGGTDFKPGNRRPPLAHRSSSKQKQNAEKQQSIAVGVVLFWEIFKCKNDTKEMLK